MHALAGEVKLLYAPERSDAWDVGENREIEILCVGAVGVQAQRGAGGLASWIGIGMDRAEHTGMPDGL